ncbi:MAG: 50S ribosomal protein L9 [Spirochaetes bacterium]|nr:50S ribosomal protein L9 [Spirochaetota bacterium]
MKVILQKDIANLGEAGDLKEVSDGYARNYLIPKKLVIVANEASKKAIEHQKRLIKIKKEKRRKESEKLANTLNGRELKFTALAGEEGKLYGSITSMDIAKKLREMGFEIDKRKIQLDSPIKELGTFKATIKLEDGLHADLSIIVEKD